MVRIPEKLNSAARRLARQAHQAIKNKPRLVMPALAGGPMANFGLMMMSGHEPRQMLDLSIGSQAQVNIAPGLTVAGERGKYQVIDKFAEGGMAEIFLVRDQQGQEHLLKRMKDFSELGQEIFQAAKLRFANEVGVMANIDPAHPGRPHIVELVDRDPQALPTFYVMENIRGKNLYDAVPVDQTLPPRLSLIITLQVLNGLMAFEQAAHANANMFQIQETLLAHRDLKPENILLELEGAKVKRAVLSDFGIVKLPGSELTAMHEFIGTLAWSAPETLLGGSKQACDQRSDIFALGAILYWLFTGTEPFNEENAGNFARDPEPVIQALYHNKPPVLSQNMWNTAFYAMAARPENRHQTYEAMGESLLRVYQEK